MNKLLFKYSIHNFMMVTTKSTDLNDLKFVYNVCSKYNLDKSGLIKIKQTHSDHILITEMSGLYNNYDGIITHFNYGIIPMIATADCVPLFIFDNISGYFGLIHCGWKGIVSGIHLKAIKKLISLGSNIVNIQCCLGPSIRECCYEIGSDIVDYFTKASIINSNGKIFLSLFKQIEIDLLDCGINKNNFNFSNICTNDNKDCASYRRNKNNQERMYSLIFKQ